MSIRVGMYNAARHRSAMRAHVLKGVGVLGNVRFVRHHVGPGLCIWIVPLACTKSDKHQGAMRNG